MITMLLVSLRSLALHMGTLGWWSLLANVLFCLSVIAMCVSGYVMRVALPRHASESHDGTHQHVDSVLPFAVIIVGSGYHFSTAIIAIVLIALLDFFISRVGFLQIIKVNKWCKSYFYLGMSSIQSMII